MYRIRTEWGARLRQVRGDRKQVDMAKLVGVSQPTWSKLERGEFEVSDTLKLQIARRVGVKVAELWSWPEGSDDSE